MPDNEEEVIIARRGEPDVTWGKVLVFVVAFVIVLGSMLYAVIETAHPPIATTAQTVQGQ